MTNQKLYEEYLTKAAEAESLADKFENDQIKLSWRAIAEGYRLMAMAQRSTVRSSKGIS